MNEKLKKLYDKMVEEDLTFLDIRELQFKIKQNYTNKDKQKYFSVINLYKTDKNLYLKIYLRNLLNKLRDSNK